MDDPTHAAISLVGGSSRGSSQGAGSASSSRRGRKEAQRTCLIPDCEDLKKAGSKFCRRHTCHRDNLLHLAGKKSDEQRQGIAEKLKDDATGAEMVEQFAAKNIP